eukprot:676337-Pleurochrysis_carterae.AAC.2
MHLAVDVRMPATVCTLRSFRLGLRTSVRANLCLARYVTACAARRRRLSCVSICVALFSLRSCAESATLFGCDCHGCCLDDLIAMVEPIKAKTVASTPGAQS